MFDRILNKETTAVYARNFIFGVEDSLVSTVGLLSGIAAAGVPKAEILVTGAVLISVEAFSMAAGSFLSESSVQEYMARRGVTSSNSFWGGGIMFLSYFISGFIPLLPYLLFAGRTAIVVSIVLSFMALFLLGFASARFLKTHMLYSGLRMLCVGGFATLVGIAIGSLAD